MKYEFELHHEVKSKKPKPEKCWKCGNTDADQWRWTPRYHGSVPPWDWQCCSCRSFHGDLSVLAKDPEHYGEYIQIGRGILDLEDGTVRVTLKAPTNEKTFLLVWNS
jgi:hypothetical protein